MSLCPVESDQRDVWRPPLSLVLGVRESLPKGARVRDGRRLQALWGDAAVEGAGKVIAAAGMPRGAVQGLRCGPYAWRAVRG